LGRRTFCISNENDWIERQFPGHYAALSYSFTPDSIREVVERALGDRSATVQAGLDMAEAAHASLPERGIVDFFETLAEHVRLAASNQVPGLQNYFLWPHVRGGRRL